MESKDPTLPSLKEALILDLLSANARPLYGLQLVALSKGKLKRGTIYVTLQRMEEKGYVISEQESRTKPEIGIPRRQYQLSELGEKVLSAHRAVRAIFLNDMIIVGS